MSISVNSMEWSLVRRREKAEKKEQEEKERDRAYKERSVTKDAERGMRTEREK